jgi:hypothetical protein
MSSFVVIGTDHNFQERDPGFEGMLRALLSRNFFEPLIGIAEEYHDKLGDSICQRLAAERGLLWYNVDMTTEERQKAGILDDQFRRPISTDEIAYRVQSDDVREQAWIEKLISSESGTTFVICGYVHFVAIVKKLRARGHTVDTRVYLDSVPEIRDLVKTA